MLPRFRELNWLAVVAVVVDALTFYFYFSVTMLATSGRRWHKVSHSSASRGPLRLESVTHASG